MKKIDFTHTGGFPLTQDRLDFLQSAYTECINALTVMGGDGSTPVIISGMVITHPAVGVTSVTSGWLFYNGEMIQFTGGTVTPSGTDVALVEITPATTTVLYNDGSTYPAVQNQTASLTTGPSIMDSTHFPVTALNPYQLAFGLNGRETGWGTILVSTSLADGNVNGTLYYKKNFLTNTLHIRATLNVFNASAFPGAPNAVFTPIGVLPSGYMPNTIAYFTTYYFGGNLFKDDVGVSWIKALTSTVNTGGQILINFLKPDAAITAYTTMFNTIIPLD